ncbi:MAG: acyl-CoA dehydrogenase family protein [Pseudomonadota bacterium]
MNVVPVSNQQFQTVETVKAEVLSFARDVQGERLERSRRTALSVEDFDRLRSIGYTLTGVPVERGGLWAGPRLSTRPYCDMLRAMAASDPSLALVSSMHPAVLVFWLEAATNNHPPPVEFTRQTDAIFTAVADGQWWGTIASEPGSGGDLMASRSIATAIDGWDCRLTGDKHMGSGSGMTDVMLTVALPAGDEVPDVYFLNVANQPWDGTTGMTLVHEWDGFGMMATQSHAFRFDDFPVERFAWPGRALEVVPSVMPTILTFFNAVALGVLDAAMASAADIFNPGRAKRRSFERVAWVRAENNYWLAEQAYAAGIHAIEQDMSPAMAVSRAKITIAELAAACLDAIGDALGAKTFSRRLPFGQWGQDVKALAHLRPPLALAFDQLYELEPTD